MATKIKVLYVCSELMPYLEESQTSKICRELPQLIQEKGVDIRTFMPRYGCINERRNQLHEVIRLSGMNIVIDDTDHQLIIKVASIPNARLQVYFIDNDDFFIRKSLYADSSGIFFADNDERSMFFSRGVIETVSKLRWSPDIIHTHGWFSAFMPAYIRSLYQDDPLFRSAKTIVSLYDDEFSGSLDEKLSQKLTLEGFDHNKFNFIKQPTYENLMKYTLQFVDGIVVAGNNVNPAIVKYAEEQGLSILRPSGESSDFSDEYYDFYDEILKKGK